MNCPRQYRIITKLKQPPATSYYFYIFFFLESLFESKPTAAGGADVQLATLIGLAKGVAGKKGVPNAESLPPS